MQQIHVGIQIEFGINYLYFGATRVTESQVDVQPNYLQ